MVEAIVEFDYKAQHDDELTISVGDIITNIRKEDGGWWEGQLKGRRGLFPDNFVREIKKDMKKESLASKAPEKSIHEVSNGSPLLLSETIIRTSKRVGFTRDWTTLLVSWHHSLGLFSKWTKSKCHVSS